MISVSFSCSFLDSHTSIIDSTIQVLQCIRSQLQGKSESLGKRFAPQHSSTPVCKICLGWDLNPRPPLPDVSTVTTMPQFLCPIGLAQGYLIKRPEKLTLSTCIK